MISYVNVHWSSFKIYLALFNLITVQKMPHRNSNTHRNKVGAVSNSQHHSILANHRQSTNKIRCTHQNT